MKYQIYIYLLITCFVYAQKYIDASFIAKTEFKAGIPVAIDNYESIYTITHNKTFQKKGSKNTFTYTNLQLGNVSSFNVFNPLKIPIFYQDFNTVIILDNKLAELFEIDFNTILPYRNVSFISTGFDNTLWLFDQNTQQLELYDYKLNSTRARTLPVQSKVLALKSNYTTCWLLTETYLYIYNYFGNLVKKIKHDGFSELTENNENIFLKKENNLYFFKNNSNRPTPIKLPNILIDRFFVTNETLYIYLNETLQTFHLNFN